MNILPHVTYKNAVIQNFSNSSRTVWDKIFEEYEMLVGKKCAFLLTQTAVSSEKIPSVTQRPTHTQQIRL